MKYGVHNIRERETTPPHRFCYWIIMSFFVLIAITIVSVLAVLKLVTTKAKGRPARNKNLPGGSMGFPVIGETLSFLKAQKEDRGAEWIDQRISKHGQVFKTSLMGSPTVVVIGQAGNKFVLGSADDVLAANQPTTLSSIAGKYNIFELTGSRYKLVKGAMVSFLKPENLQNYIKPMDDAIKALLVRETMDKNTIEAVLVMKKLTFNIACYILFGIKDELVIHDLFIDFQIAFEGVWSLPVNFPGTLFWKGLQARSRISERMLPIIRKRKDDLSKGNVSPTSDVISCMLSLIVDENEGPITEEEIVDNFVTLMIASHDTSAILLSLFIWKLARDPEICHKVLQEQMDIIRKRENKEDRLTWGEIQKMKYTWRVAQELMRLIPPVFGSFRKALKDTSFGGYDIPKGWQVFWVAYPTHMDADIFNNPTEFAPSRFENPSKPIPPYAYIPFGGGFRPCIGNEFARVETLTTIHNLITRYEWSQLNPNEIITRQPMPYPSMGLPIKLKPRNAA